MTGNELRERFLKFFESKSHLILPSASLIPENDPTLLLIGAGMAPFKPFFTGKMKPPHTRITTSQKCVRTGDIENVGRTARHHTFFEMLGNFSFGDYFKKEAIAWAWEFLTVDLNLPKDKLWITIHTEDDEAFEIWHKDIGIEPERIIRMADNFWEIGPGPCGPCSEIYVDLGESRGCGRPECAVGCDCDRFLEIWNLVFTQFDRTEDGEYLPLAKKNIDTGAGLERLASVLQNKPSNFETDLIFPIIEHTQKIAKVTYGVSAQTDVSLKVIADHARSMTVMIADGVLPSNEGRGYVLRRILRRAVRHARLIGIEQMFLSDIVDIVINIFSNTYPELNEKKDYIKKVIQLEEKRFHETLVQGMEMLNGHIESLKTSGVKILDGATVFKLYDTFGFPWELTNEILIEHDMDMDKDGFDEAMNAQRERARTARQESEERVIIPDLSGLVTDLKEDLNADTANLIIALKDGKVVSEVHDGEEVAVILDVTPFHAEGGGQVGDSGLILGPLGKIEVFVTRKLPDGTIYHQGKVIEGTVKAGEAVSLEVDIAKRLDIARNHTATHLLHAALKKVLGEHVNQAGSYVGPDRLRFDFSHFAQVTADQLEQIEQLVNDEILKNTQVGIIETTQNLAKEMGAMALFGEKYGDKVRVVIIDGFSKELCGGTHVNSTAEIGFLKILSEAGTGAGVRRIEAVTGHGALKYIDERSAILYNAASLLKTRPEEILTRIEALNAHVKELEHELDGLTAKLAKSQVQDILNSMMDIDGIQVVASAVTASNMDDLRNIADLIRDNINCGIAVLGAVCGDKVNFVAMTTKDAVAKGIHSGKVIKEVAAVAGGGGGGRPDMAQAGGKEPDKLNDALQKAIEVIKSQIK